MKTETNQTKHTQGVWKQSGHVMPSETLAVHTERVFCQFIDTKFASTKPALAFGGTKEEAEANAQRIVTAVNEYDSLKKKEVINKELIKRSKLLADFASKVLMYPKGLPGYDPADKINLQNQIDKMDLLLKQAEGK